jgi:hypothetical protein
MASLHYPWSFARGAALAHVARGAFIAGNHASIVHACMHASIASSQDSKQYLRNHPMTAIH